MTIAFTGTITDEGSSAYSISPPLFRVSVGDSFSGIAYFNVPYPIVIFDFGGNGTGISDRSWDATRPYTTVSGFLSDTESWLSAGGSGGLEGPGESLSNGVFIDASFNGPGFSQLKGGGWVGAIGSVSSYGVDSGYSYSGSIDRIRLIPDLAGTNSLLAMAVIPLFLYRRKICLG